MVLLFIFWCGTLFAAAQPMLHLEDDFHFTNQPKQAYTRHVLFPVEDRSLESLMAPYWLAMLSSDIYSDAQMHGYLQGASRSHYLRELEVYGAGKWPIIFITKKDDLRPLIHLAFAHRWDDSPLPWEARFGNDNDGYLPQQVRVEERVGVGSFNWPILDRYRELRSEQNRDLWEVLKILRPAIIGEKTELKFLFGDKPSLLLLREIFNGVIKYGLHRNGYRRLSGLAGQAGH